MTDEMQTTEELVVEDSEQGNQPELLPGQGAGLDEEITAYDEATPVDAGYAEAAEDDEGRVTVPGRYDVGQAEVTEL
jgi:hypothetical protein